MEATAFLGVIAMDLNVFYYELYKKSVNSEKFIPFLQKLRRKVGKAPIILYMDNLRVHWSKLVKPYYAELNITPVWAPSYSPMYNPIEFVFSKLKGSVRRIRLNDMMKGKKRTYYEMVPEAVSKLTNEDVNNCIKHVYKLFNI
jgi:transposase